MQNKNHWYDGWFYDNLIAPNQDRMFGEIKNLIEPNSSVIDVGCGTGRFSFSIADRANMLVGVDLSSKNITKANQTLQRYPNKKISFLHTNLANLVAQNHHFDYAVMTYVIHEVNFEDRIPLMNEMAKVADNIIIGDYLVPATKGFWSMLNNIVEFLAGKEHFSNFKNFVTNNGLLGLMEKTELKLIQEIKNKPKTSHILLLTK